MLAEPLPYSDEVLVYLHGQAARLREAPGRDALERDTRNECELALRELCELYDELAVDIATTHAGRLSLLTCVTAARSAVEKAVRSYAEPSPMPFRLFAARLIRKEIEQTLEQRIISGSDY